MTGDKRECSPRLPWHRSALSYVSGLPSVQEQLQETRERSNDKQPRPSGDESCCNKTTDDPQQLVALDEVDRLYWTKGVLSRGPLEVEQDGFVWPENYLLAKVRFRIELPVVVLFHGFTKIRVAVPDWFLLVFHEFKDCWIERTK